MFVFSSCMLPAYNPKLRLKKVCTPEICTRNFSPELLILFFFPLSSLQYFFSLSGVGSLQRTPSQRSAMIYQRNNYTLNTAATYADPYHRLPQYRPSEPGYARQPIVMDDGATRSPSIDSIQKDPRSASLSLFRSRSWPARISPSALSVFAARGRGPSPPCCLLVSKAHHRLEPPPPPSQKHVFKNWD